MYEFPSESRVVKTSKLTDPTEKSHTLKVRKKTSSVNSWMYVKPQHADGKAKLEVVAETNLNLVRKTEECRIQVLTEIRDLNSGERLDEELSLPSVRVPSNGRVRYSQDLVCCQKLSGYRNGSVKLVTKIRFIFTLQEEEFLMVP